MSVRLRCRLKGYRKPNAEGMNVNEHFSVSKVNSPGHTVLQDAEIQASCKWHTFQRLRGNQGVISYA